MTNHLLDILLALSKADVKYVVVGGVAVVLHGVERMTLDLDLVVEMTRENVQRLIDVFYAIQLTPRVPEKPEVLLEPEAVRRMRDEKNAMVFSFWDINNPFRQVDIFITPAPSYSDVFSDSKKVDVKGTAVYLASPDRLIEMKRNVNPMRPKDISDVSELLKIKRRFE